LPLVPVFLRMSPGLAFFAMLAVAVSGFGQTFFISVFGEEIRTDFGLSHTAYGTLYSLATVVSAFMLFRWGRLADAWSLPKATALAVALLALGCFVMGMSGGALLLWTGFLLIRFGGQGLISHLGLTTAARFFPGHRGKAVAFAAAGFPLAEAVLPPAGVLLAGLGDWRIPWLLSAVILLVCILPLLGFLSRSVPVRHMDKEGAQKKAVQRNYTREEVLRDPGFYFLLPAAVASPFMVTALLFHQAAIASIQGWSMQTVGLAFSGYAAGHLGALVGAGTLVDRFSAAGILPLSVLPMALALMILAGGDGLWVIYVYLFLMGITHGFASTASGALWAERYGILHLGGIRAMAQSAVVLSTAASPLMLGFLLDMHISLGLLAGALCVSTVAAAVMAKIAPDPVIRNTG